MENDKQQTAVELLIAEIDEQAKTCPRADRKFYVYCKRLAKQKLKVEKKNIVDAFENGANDIYYDLDKFEDGEQYYKETYE